MVARFACSQDSEHKIAFQNPKPLRSTTYSISRVPRLENSLLNVVSVRSSVVQSSPFMLWHSINDILGQQTSRFLDWSGFYPFRSITEGWILVDTLSFPHPGLAWDWTVRSYRRLERWGGGADTRTRVTGCIPGGSFPASRSTYYLPTKEKLTIIK